MKPFIFSINATAGGGKTTITRELQKRLPNGNVTGFLDWGNGGIADRWQDIALCVRSIKHNYTEEGLYNENEFIQYKKLLFDELGIISDEEKIRYYILLDELF